MSFQRLPSAVLQKIFEYVGDDEFRRTDLLCLSKAWYNYARSVLYRDITISGTSARLLSKIGPETIQLIRKDLRRFTLDVNMRRDSGWPRTNRPTGTLPGNQTNRMNKSFLEITRILAKCENLQQVTMRLINNLPPESAVMGRCMLETHIWNFISGSPLENLTSLSLEISGIITYEHACKAIGQQLYNLRRLWIRMDRICPDLFVQEIGAVTPASMRLERLVINLRRLNCDGGLSKLNAECCKQRCGKYFEMPSMDPWDLHRLIFEQVKVLGDKAGQKCKLMRIIYYDREAGGSKAIDFVPELKSTLLSRQEEEYEGFREAEGEGSEG
jgi:hypothetical protein